MVSRRGLIRKRHFFVHYSNYFMWSNKSLQLKLFTLKINMPFKNISSWKTSLLLLFTILRKNSYPKNQGYSFFFWISFSVLPILNVKLKNLFFGVLLKKLFSLIEIFFFFYVYVFSSYFYYPSIFHLKQTYMHFWYCHSKP